MVRSRTVTMLTRVGAALNCLSSSLTSRLTDDVHTHTVSCAALGSVVAEVESDDGHIGIGISIGGDPAAYIIEKHLR